MRCGNGHLFGRGNALTEKFASHATDATRRDKAWDRAGKLRLVMRNRTILVAVLISPYLSQKEAATGVRVSAGSTLGYDPTVAAVVVARPVRRQRRGAHVPRRAAVAAAIAAAAATAAAAAAAAVVPRKYE